MKIAVFSDIHGNLAAWQAGLSQMREWSAERHVFLGDLCGYYYGQMAILEDLLALPGLVAVRGNHDQMFLDIFAGDEELRQGYARRYGSSMERLLRQDTSALRAWLASLPHQAWAGPALCVHGTPGSPLEGYLYPDSEQEQSVAGHAGAILLGHTHHRMLRVIGRARVLNPGSLGQPRDNKPACWAAWDTAADDVRFMDVRFDTGGLARQVMAAGSEPAYLIDVLKRIPEGR